MKIDIAKFEKAGKLFDQIKKLDSEIIEIDKFAMLSANGDNKASLSMSIDKEKEEVVKPVLDEDNSLARGLLSYISPFSWSEGYRAKSTQADDKHCVSYEVSVNVTMQILGVLLREKQIQRDALIVKLNKMGVIL